MQISVSPFSGTQSVASPGHQNSGAGHSYLSVVLGAFAVFPALLIVFKVHYGPDQSAAGIYGLAAFSFFAVAMAQLALLPRRAPAALRVRWYLWVGFLILNTAGLLSAFLGDKGIVHLSVNIKITCFSLGYALAYIVTVNPPRSTVWRRLWVVDAMIASVMGVVFFLVYHYGEPAGVYTSLLFAVAIQVIFALGSLLSLRTAASREARELARFMTVYFVLNAIVAGMDNLPHVWPRLPFASIGGMLYSVPTAILALMPLIMQMPFLRRFSRDAHHTHALPPAAPVLITCAILLACLPLLHFNIVTGIALLIAAIGLFAVRVALMQNDFEYERTSLLRSNKQLRELAYIDPVTGIANRRRFLEVAGEALLVARRGIEPHWLVLIELENLRSVFASSGRRASELYLCEFVELIRPTLDPATMHFAHIANGEFAVLLKRANQETLELTVQQIRDALYPARVNIATGAALATSSGPDTVERWLANAGNVLHRNRGFFQ